MGQGWATAMWSGVFAAASVLILLSVFMLYGARPLIKYVLGRVIARVMSEAYKDNVWEMVTATVRAGPIAIVENSMRAGSGKIIKRPFGSPRKFLNFDGLVFSPAQLHRLPAYGSDPVDMKTTIGPMAQRPLVLDIPLFAGGMGYAIGLSGTVKRALARATAATGTATNSGEGAFFPDERALAKSFILQYTPGSWAKSPDILRQADAIEIHIGQGASAASTNTVTPEDLPGDIRESFDLSPGETLVIPSRFESMKEPGDLKPLVDSLRRTTGGVPIGVKLCASGELEADLEVAIEAGVDFICMDGGQAGTKGGAPIFEDDFGLPTVYALCRSVAYLKRRGMHRKVSLLVGGGLLTPGECLKALALGADAVYMGTAFLWAMSHDQIGKSMPWEPPTQLVYFSGKMKDRFNEDDATRNLERFIRSCTAEMEEAVRALGKRSVRSVNAEEDLVALDAWTSKVTKVRLAYGPEV
ncbi:FMN-binding glutamate synthase family protein [Paenibacillus sp. TRM 82003]|nr:FMN-binding glutamate synthase family protein [Paenibacillus sp. TRM 82003]